MIFWNLAMIFWNSAMIFRSLKPRRGGGSYSLIRIKTAKTS